MTQSSLMSCVTSGLIIRVISVTGRNRGISPYCIASPIRSWKLDNKCLGFCTFPGDYISFYIPPIGFKSFVWSLGNKGDFLSINERQLRLKLKFIERWTWRCFGLSSSGKQQLYKWSKLCFSRQDQDKMFPSKSRDSMNSRKFICVARKFFSG